MNWLVVVAVKPPAIGKSRLVAAGAHRPELALAMASDTVAAAMAAPGVRAVLVVSSDVEVAAAMKALGAVAVGEQTDDGLNRAFARGIAAGGALDPAVAVALLAGDLPALRPAELGEALARAGRAGLAVVADSPGTGSTLLASTEPARLRPRFGADSLQRHVRAGATEILGLEIPGLRRDVDTPADLQAAIALGVGPATTAVLAARGLLDLDGPQQG